MVWRYYLSILVLNTLIIFTVYMNIKLCMFSYNNNICKYRIEEKKLIKMQNGGMLGGLSTILLKLFYTFKNLILHLKFEYILNFIT